MKFIKFAHPEGGTQAVNVERITSVFYRQLEGGKDRLSMDLGEKDGAVVLFGEEATRVWHAIEAMIPKGPGEVE